jgi:Zn-dependent protease with chaperone function
MRLLQVIVTVTLFSSLCHAKDVKIHGFVTTVNSPTNFEIDDYRITRDTSLVLEVEKDEGSAAAATFRPEDIHVGTELEIKGDYNEQTGELNARSIKVFSEDTRVIKRTALVEKVPELTKADQGWTGVFFADGQRVTIAPSAKVTYKLNKHERKNLKNGSEEESALASLAVINLETFMHYEGSRQADGSISASKVEFQHAEMEDGEAKLWARLRPKIKDPDYSGFRSGELRMEKAKYKLIPSREAQEYIERIGESIIPPAQRDLPAGDPLKIPFHFYLIQDKSFNASAYPNGVVIVHSGLFDVLENESQLAFVLSHEVTHATEKHTWRQHEYHKKALTALKIGGMVGAGFGGRGVVDITNLIEGAIRNGYARSLENQADRVGLENMLAAGYDIREGPRTWKVVAKKYGDRATNLFWDNHDNNTTRRSYLMAELRNNYSDADYSLLKKDSDDFHHVVEFVQQAEQNKKKIKVKVSPRHS